MSAGAPPATRATPVTPKAALLGQFALGLLAVPGFGLPDLAETITHGAASLREASSALHSLGPALAQSDALRIPGAVSPTPTFHALLPLLPVLALAGLWRAIAAPAGGSPRRAASLGGAWGLGLFLGGVSWVYVSMADVAGLAPWLAALATLLFCAYLALYPALACAAYVALQRRAGATVPRPWLFAALWALSEWLRGTLFTGFPWLALGYSQVPPSPLAGYASVLGVYGLSLVTALAGAALVALLVAATRRRALLTLTVLLALGQLLRVMVWVEPVGEPVRVRLLQGNVPQTLKWRPEHLQQSVDTYLGLLHGIAREPASTVPTLNVLPETAIPLLFDQIPPELRQALAARSDTLLGVAVRTLDDGYANAAVALPAGGEGAEGIYAKRHLVPFGEYSPPGFGWFFQLLRIPMADFTAGAARQSPLALAGQRIAPNICYEDLFGEELLPGLAEATLLINLSNTAWFGASLAQPQHLQIARLRALETGRVMLRATNSGMTAMIRPDGEVMARLPAFTTGVLRVEVQGYAGLTPYARWGNTLILSLSLTLLALAWRRRPAARV